jgi:hypothetical protein
MAWPDRHNAYSDEELAGLFRRLFPGGLGGADVEAELVPEGWSDSPFVRCFHPTVERAYEEYRQVHENLRELTRDRPGAAGNAAGPGSEEPESLAEFQARFTPAPVEAKQELTDLVGLCVWDIFSDNHDVTDPHGRAIDIGSFRGAGAFIAAFAAGQADGEGGETWPDRADYLRFYLGTIWIGGRCDLTPVYVLIFRRMHAQGLDWRYVFPRLGVVRFEKPEDRDSPPGQHEWEGYSPSAAVARDLERRQREADAARFEAELDAMYRESVAKARHGPPPSTVAAYRQIYGRLPIGWPPS